jgi:hypothetical protein
MVVVLKDIKKNGISYSALTKLCHYIDESLELREAFKALKLDPVTTKSYIDLIEKTEKMNYSEEGNLEKIKINTSLLKKLEKAITKYKSNEY